MDNNLSLLWSLFQSLLPSIHFDKGVLCLDVFNLCLLALHLRVVYVFMVTQMPLGFDYTCLVVYYSF